MRYLASTSRSVTFVLASFLALAPLTRVSAQSIITIAGGGPRNIAASEASLYRPVSLAMGPGGTLYITDSVGEHDAVLMLDSLGRLSRVAGYAALDCLSPVSTGDGGPAARACIDHPEAVAVDAAGNLYIADTAHYLVRRVDALSGLITTVAGSGAAGYGGDGGSATAAAVKLSFVSGLAVDAAGNLFIADAGNYRIRRVDSVTGFISTVVGTGTRTGSFDGEGGDPIDDLGDQGPASSCSLSAPSAVFVDAGGSLYISDAGNFRVRRVTSGIIDTIAGHGAQGSDGENVPALSASLAGPADLAVDGGGNVYFGDFDESDPVSHRVRRVDAVTGLIRTVAGIGSAGFSGDGGPATSAKLDSPSGVAVDGAGNLFIADRDNKRVRRVSASTGLISTVAGSGDGGGHEGTSTSLYKPEGVYFEEDPDRLYVAEPAGHRVRLLDLTSGIITTLAGTGTPGYNGDGVPATMAELNYPTSASLDEFGNVVIGESSGHRVRRVDAVTGMISTIAGTGIAACGPDGVQATVSDLMVPAWALPDEAGSVFIADFACHKIRRLDMATGIITNYAGTGVAGFSGDGGPATNAAMNGPGGLALDAAGNLFVAESNNRRIRRIDAVTKVITTVAGGGSGGDGGLATSANLRMPVAVAVDGAGSLFIADARSHSVRRVDAVTKIISTVAGTPTSGFSGDGGPATSARLYQPYSVHLDDHGNLYIADAGNNRIRSVRVAPVDSGVVPDGSSPGDEPLEVVPAAGGAITLSWGSSCSASDNDFEVYEGSLGSFTSHTSRFCSTGGATARTFTPAAGDSYYLVVPRNGSREGSYGLRSDGSERPPATASCLPQAVGTCQ